MIESLDNGKVVVDALAGTHISKFISLLAKFFTPFSNMYGVRKIETEFNCFEVEIDRQNAHNIEEYYDMSMRISSDVAEREWQEYIQTPEYMRERAKELRADIRKKAVISKIRELNKGRSDFKIDIKKMSDWEKCKKINSKDDYNQCVIDYTIFWKFSRAFLK